MKLNKDKFFDVIANMLHSYSAYVDAERLSAMTAAWYEKLNGQQHDVVTKIINECLDEKMPNALQILNRCKIYQKTLDEKKAIQLQRIESRDRPMFEHDKDEKLKIEETIKKTKEQLRINLLNDKQPKRSTTRLNPGVFSAGSGYASMDSGGNMRTISEVALKVL